MNQQLSHQSKEFSNKGSDKTAKLIDDIEDLYEAASNHTIAIDEKNEKPDIQRRPLPATPNAQLSNDVEHCDNGAGEDNFYSDLITSNEYTPLDSRKASSSSNQILSTSSQRRSIQEAQECTRTKTVEHRPLLSELTEDSATNYLTLTGTLMKKRQKTEVKPNQVDDTFKQFKPPLNADHVQETCSVHLNLTPETILGIEKRIHAKYHDRCFCGIRRGIHVFLLTMLALPMALVYSTLQAYYLGTLTWYNIFIYYNEERSLMHKICSPFLLLLYPLWIVPCAIFLGVFGGLYQLSWYLDSWKDALEMPDAGFFQWFCEDFLSVEGCCPYEIILLSPTAMPENFCPV